MKYFLTVLSFSDCITFFNGTLDELPLLDIIENAYDFSHIEVSWAHKSQLDLNLFL